MFIGNSPVLYRIAKGAARSALMPFFRLDVTGEENLATSEPLVLLPKHQRWEDIPLLSLASPKPLHYVAKYELFQNRITDCLLRFLGGIPLNRKKPVQSRKSFQRVPDLLEQGYSVVIFPEGTYFPNTIGNGHSGMIRFVMNRFSATFLPVGIRYFGAGLRIRVRIRFGRPCRASDCAGTAEQFLRTMLREIACLSGLENQISGKKPPRRFVNSGCRKNTVDGDCCRCIDSNGGES